MVMLAEALPGQDRPRWRDRDRAAGEIRRAPVAVRAGIMPWVPFWMALGIGGWLAAPFEPGRGSYLALALIGIAALALWWFLPRMAGAGMLDWDWADLLRLSCLSVMLIAAGAGLAGLRSYLVAAPILQFRYYGPVEGRVIKIDRSGRDRIRLTLDRVVLDNVSPEKIPERVRISLFQPDPLPEPGERVMLTAHLGPPPGPAEPGGFDFRRMAWFERLGAIGYSRTPVMSLASPDAWLASHRLRMRLSEGIQQRIEGQAGAVAAAMMTGDRSGITERTNDIMRASNLYHIISISGLHMSMLSGFVYAALRLAGVTAQGAGIFVGRKVHKYAAFGALMTAGGYLWLSGGDVATERSFIMVAVMLLAIIADRRAVSLRTVAIAAALILIVTPEALASPGFQMSFAATVALILSSERWQAIYSPLPWWIKPVAMLLVSSLVASLATGPIAAATFGRVAHYGIIANLFAVPVVGLIVMPAGVVAALLAPLGMVDLPLWFMGLGTQWMLWVAQDIANISGATTLLYAPPPIVLPLLGMGACLICLSPIRLARGFAQAVLLRRTSGIAMLVSAGISWLTHDRPDLLISDTGGAVGILTENGRALSKPEGDAFVASMWLEADGDWRDQKTAAKNELWEGRREARNAVVATRNNQVQVYHITGKSALQTLREVCNHSEIVVTNLVITLAESERLKCNIFDQRLLKRTGAIAIFADRKGIISAVAAQQRSGVRSWVNSTKGIVSLSLELKRGSND